MTPAASTPAARPPPASARRSSLRFAAGLFVAGVLITAALLALTSGGGTTTKPPPPPPAKLPKLTEAFNDRVLGVTGVATRRWVIGGLGPILHMVSVDRRAVIVIDAPGSPKIVHGALHVAIANIRKYYKNVTLAQAPGVKLGGLPAYSVVMHGTNPVGSRLRILISSAAGRRVTYVVEVYTANNATLLDLEEAQEIFSTLRFNL